MEDVLIECSPGISGDMLLGAFYDLGVPKNCLLYTSPSPRDDGVSRMPSSA